jgi:hypothetical protein
MESSQSYDGPIRIVPVSGEAPPTVPKSELTDISAKEGTNSKREEYPNTDHNHKLPDPTIQPQFQHRSFSSGGDLTIYITRIVEQ